MGWLIPLFCQTCRTPLTFTLTLHIALSSVSNATYTHHMVEFLWVLERHRHRLPLCCRAPKTLVATSAHIHSTKCEPQTERTNALRRGRGQCNAFTSATTKYRYSSCVYRRHCRSFSTFDAIASTLVCYFIFRWIPLQVELTNPRLLASRDLFVESCRMQISWDPSVLHNSSFSEIPAFAVCLFTHLHIFFTLISSLHNWLMRLVPTVSPWTKVQNTFPSVIIDRDKCLKTWCHRNWFAWSGQIRDEHNNKTEHWLKFPS